MRIPQQDSFAVSLQPVGTPELRAGSVIPVQNPVGEQLQQLGGAVQQAGQAMTGIALEEQSRIDVATIKRQLNALRERVQKRVTDFGGLLGQDAVRDYVQVRQDLMTARREVEGPLDEYQRELFKDNADAMMFAAEEDARAHWQKQTKASEIAETGVRAQGLLEDTVKAGLALQTPDGMSRFAATRAQALREVELLSALKGAGPAETEALVKKADAEVHAAIVKTMLESRDTAGASQYLSTWSERMPPDVVADLRGKIDTVAAAENGARLGAGILTAAQSVEAETYGPPSPQDPPEDPTARFLRQQVNQQNAIFAAKREVFRRFDEPGSTMSVRERDAAIKEIEAREKLDKDALDSAAASVIKQAQAYWAANPHMEAMDPRILAMAAGFGVLDKVEKPAAARQNAAETAQQNENYGNWLAKSAEELRLMREDSVFKTTTGPASTGGLSEWQRKDVMERWAAARDGKSMKGYDITPEDTALIDGIARRSSERLVRRLGLNMAFDSQRGQASREFNEVKGRATEQIVRQLAAVQNPTRKDFLAALEQVEKVEVEYLGERRLAVELDEQKLGESVVTLRSGGRVSGRDVDWPSYYRLQAEEQAAMVRRTGRGLTEQEAQELLGDAVTLSTIPGTDLVPLETVAEVMGVKAGWIESSGTAALRKLHDLLGRRPTYRRATAEQIGRRGEFGVPRAEVEEAMRKTNR